MAEGQSCYLRIIGSESVQNQFSLRSQKEHKVNEVIPAENVTVKCMSETKTEIFCLYGRCKSFDLPQLRTH